MIHLLPTDPPVVDHHPEAVRRALLAGQLPGHAQHPPQHGLVLEVGIVEVLEVDLDHDAAFARLDLYSGGSESAGREAARHDAAAWGHDIRRFEEGVLLEVQQAWHDLQTAKARLTTAANSVQAAREALRVREHRFTQGLDKMIDLLDAETAVREAELRELVARYDVSLSSYRLLFASGANLTPTTEESP